MKMLLLVATFFLMTSGSPLAWSGIDGDTQKDVEIEKGNLVRRGRTIEIYEPDEDKYTDVEVDRIRDRGSYVEIEAYDWDKGEYRTFEMDKH